MRSGLLIHSGEITHCSTLTIRHLWRQEVTFVESVPFFHLSVVSGDQTQLLSFADSFTEPPGGRAGWVTADKPGLQVETESFERVMSYCISSHLLVREK